jgi:heptosyltransferase-3
MNFNVIKRILVIKLRHIGDVLLTVPVFRALRETFPRARISALVNSGTEEVLSGNPLIDEILCLDRGIKKLSLKDRYLREVNFLKDIRRKDFDMTVDLTGGDRAAIISFASGAKYRLGWSSKKGFIGKKYLYSHLFEPDGKKHMVLQNLDVIGQIGINTENLSVDFHIPEDDRVFIRKILEENMSPSAPLPPHPPLTKGGRKGGKEGLRNTIIHIHPTSRWLFKCWKDEYMAEILKWLLEREIIVIVTASPDMHEIKKAKKILSLVFGLTPPLRHPLGKGGHMGVIDLCGRTTIKQLAAISEVSNVFFGVDSAPMHIAAAVGTPVIALFGPSGAYNWGPWDNESSKFKVQSSKFENPYIQRNGIQTFSIHTVIQREWDCIPCGKDGCNSTKISKCLEDIKPEGVIKVIEDRLKI